MKKETLLEIILGTIGGLVFAIGMCMGLIPEWDMLGTGIVVGIIGFIILLCIVPVHRKGNWQRKRHDRQEGSEPDLRACKEKGLLPRRQSVGCSTPKSTVACSIKTISSDKRRCGIFVGDYQG